MDLKSLIGKLTETSRRGLEGAAGLCLSRTNYEVEMEHWLAKLLENSDGDIPRLLRHADLDPDRVLRGLERGLDQYKRGNGGKPQLAPAIEDMARQAWLLASINYRASRVRSGVLFLACLGDRNLRRQLLECCPELKDVALDELVDGLPQIVAGSPEDREVFSADQAPGRELGEPAAGRGATPSLDQFTVDLTADARAGRIDPVLGRDPEIRQIIDILTRRRQNNPILTGEAGVGKTAVVEGFALRIVAGDVPPVLRNVALRSLDLGLLQAGAGVKGEFENRLKQVIEEVRSSPQPIILFIDEAHTLIGAGGQEGQNDAANLLKPALARGELRTVAATTWAEYKKYFEKDPALTRRFQVVKVEEPDEPAAIRMMRGVAAKLEQHHRVRILDDAVRESVRLSHRYIPARQLPDKSVSVLDTACARVGIGRSATPAAVEDLRRVIDAIAVETGILQRESALGRDHAARLAELAREKEEAAGRMAALEERWRRELELVDRIIDLRGQVELAVNPPPADQGQGEAPAAADLPGLRRELDDLRAELCGLQGESPLVQYEVDGQTIAEVIGGWTGIPVGRMLADEIQTVLGLGPLLQRRVIGQDHALETIAQRIRTSRANLDNPQRPVGVFLLVGPSGVGKTESALALAESMYGGERNLITINMSEYQEAHTVSSLKGAPPGYVGYGEGGVLTEAVRRRPYAVVLLDEVEKAHPDVMELFFQVFDKGMLEDGEGREIDFKNTVILLTSNVGTDTTMKLCADPETRPEPEGLAEALRPELLKAFPAALLGRMITVPYYPLDASALKLIIELQLGKIRRRLAVNHGAELVYDGTLLDAVVGRCSDPQSGARNIDHILTRSLLPEISTEILARVARGETLRRVNVGLAPDGAFRYELD
ncbi:MAG: type VI secretion system ATPase TssH [Krumholzibacteria bacterium]|nr:type VI secretion system ATPase TssH [Candidatus Krumholzibacteria bacterium]